MAGSKENCRIKELRNYLRGLSGGENYAIIGNKPYAKGCRLIYIPADPESESYTTIQTDKNFDMLGHLTDPNLDLFNPKNPLWKSQKQKGLFNQVELIDNRIVSYDLLRATKDLGEEFLELARICSNIDRNTQIGIETVLSKINERMKKQREPKK